LLGLSFYPEGKEKMFLRNVERYNQEEHILHIPFYFAAITIFNQSLSTMHESSVSQSVLYSPMRCGEVT
jgi:hypothetical protein